jgi:hypothetical protein
MHLHWGGDIISRNTRIPNKRFVIGSPRTPVATDIREWLRSPDDRILQDTLRSMPGIVEGSAWGAFDRRAYVVWDYVTRNVRYNGDKDRQGYHDFWLFPDETLSLGIGDCEDSAILLGALLIAADISSYCVRVVASYSTGAASCWASTPGRSTRTSGESGASSSQLWTPSRRRSRRRTRLRRREGNISTGRRSALTTPTSGGSDRRTARTWPPHRAWMTT